MHRTLLAALRLRFRRIHRYLAMIHKHGVCFANVAIALAVDGQLSALNAYIRITARHEVIGGLAVHVRQSLQRRDAGTVAIGNTDSMLPDLRFHFSKK